MRNVYFDICSIPLYVLILWTCYFRRITKDHASRVFIRMNVVSLVCAVLDIAMEFVVNPLPLSGGRVALGTAISFSYLLLRNATLVLYLIYVYAATRTEYRIRSPRARFMIWAPNAVVVALLLINFVRPLVFSVTAEEGYARGPLMPLVYAIAALYGIVGGWYCLRSKKYLPAGKWIALISVYVLTFIAVFVQLFAPVLLVEMFSTALGLLMIMLLVMRPEESIDASVGIASWKSYQTDLQNILRTGQPVQIAVVQVLNADEIRSYIGEDDYAAFIRSAADGFEEVLGGEKIDVTMYYERPGAFYLILEDMGVDVPALVPRMVKAAREKMGAYAGKGIRFDPRFCVIRCPEDLKEYQDIVNLGHRLSKLGVQGQEVFLASELIGSKDYAVTNHMDEILHRAITEGTLVMYYQPIYNMREEKFRSAEALARIDDPKYGLISPGLFIPAAESAGLILPMGDIILELVFRFISEHDLARLGLSFIEINLSVAQCLQADLVATVKALQDKYGVSPSQVNFEVTETIFDNLSTTMDKNLRELASLGYSFSLDDYGVGYSNIQRLRTLPLDIIKIDKSMVDDMFTEDGEVIIKNTVRMMKGIHKELIVEGVETKEAIEAVNALSCDFIQGFYYSKPLPEAQFLRFIEQNNGIAARQ